MQDYPQEWNDLPRSKRRKKIKALRRERAEKKAKQNQVRNLVIGVVVVMVMVVGFWQLNKKSPKEAAFEQELAEVSLEGRVEEFEIEGRDHVDVGSGVSYKTNPPTSGDHLAEAERWGVYNKEIDDLQGVHSLEHGGIWISYKDISEEAVAELEQIGRDNSQSVIVSPREANDDQVVIASWGRMMRLTQVDRALIQKYIDEYKNDSPEKLAR